MPQLSLNRQQFSRIAQQYDLVFVVLFGSRARGEQPNPESDVDIAVLAKNDPEPKLFGDLYGEFSDLIPHENVDVRFLNDANFIFRYQVTKDGVLLAGDQQAYQAYVAHAWRAYVDDGRKYFPFRDRMLEKKQKALEEAL